MRSIALLFIVISFAAQAQVKLVARKEISSDLTNMLSTFPIKGTPNMLMVTGTYERPIKSRTLTVVDNKLEKLKSVSFDIEVRKGDLTTSFMDKDRYYYCTHNRKSGELHVTEFQLPELTKRSVKTLVLKKTRVSDYVAGDNCIFLQLKVKKNDFIGVLDFATGKIKYIYPETEFGENGFVYGSTKIEGLHPEVLFQFDSKKKAEYNTYAVRFKANGERLKAWKLPNEPHNLVDYTLSRVADGKYLMMGEYSSRSRSSSEGIFTSFVDDNGKFQPGNYYNYIDIPHFTEYLSERKQKKIERKDKRKEAKGKDLVYQFRVALHSIQFDKTSQQYIFIGEFYYPTYRQEAYSCTINGQISTCYRTVFDGYQYSHALAAGFDLSGKMVWSNVFEMWLTYKPFYVKQFITSSIVDGELQLAFATGSQIKTIAMKEGTISNTREIQWVETENKDDAIKRTAGSDIDHWFNKYYVSSGWQKIKNKEGSDKRKRKVYFANVYSY